MKNVSFLILPLLILSCTSKAQNMNDYNKITKEYADAALYKNGKTAYQVRNPECVFYAASGEKILLLNKESRLVKIYDKAWAERLLGMPGGAVALSGSVYFLPSAYKETHEFATGAVGTASGDFYYKTIANPLGLPATREQDISPEKKEKGNWTYNRLGQLLKNDWKEGVGISNTYDDRGLLIRHETEGKTEEYTYDNQYRLLSLNREEQVMIKPGKHEKKQGVLHFTYNAQGQLSKKYSSEDDYTTYAYDGQGRLINELTYKAESKEDPGKVNSSFIEHQLVYDEQNNVKLETKNTYVYDRANKLVNGKWVDIDVAAQKEEAWAQFNSELKIRLLRRTESVNYVTNAAGDIVKSQTRSFRYMNNGKEEWKEEDKSLYRDIEYTYNDKRQVVQRKLVRETAAGGENTPEVTVYTYE